MASSHKEIAERKFKLLERFRSALLEEILEEGREQAMVEREHDRFAWKSAFRPREEIMVLYRERKKWDRRFLIDSAGLAVVLALVVFATPILVKVVAPKSNWERDARTEMETARNPEVPPNPTEGVAPLGEE
ncbi:MAG: hypothetical protein ACYTEP_00205 [Planctomycetota bacterium]|jgi:hypothetical protein